MALSFLANSLVGHGGSILKKNASANSQETLLIPATHVSYASD